MGIGHGEVVGGEQLVGPQLPPPHALLYPSHMRKVLIIGTQGLQPLKAGLEEDGYEVLLSVRARDFVEHQRRRRQWDVGGDVQI